MVLLSSGGETVLQICWTQKTLFDPLKGEC